MQPIDILQQTPLFSGLSQKELTYLIDQATPLTINPGQSIIKEGQPADSFYLITSGEFEVTKHSDRQDILLSQRRAGEVIGEIAFLEGGTRTATVTAAQKSRVLKIDRAVFKQFFRDYPDAVLTLFQTAVSRLEQSESILLHTEKMAQLGTFTAGIAHELNNPIAAIERSTSQITGALNQLLESVQKAKETNLSFLTDTQINQAIQAWLSHAPNIEDRPERIETLTSWLIDRQLENPYHCAPSLADLGVTPQKLETLLPKPITKPQATAFIRYLILVNHLKNVTIASGRVATIVSALKSYVYLDQAPVQAVDIHRGLEDTLVILEHKLKNLTVKKTFDPQLPTIEAYGSELNQVWTNIIDNAADAMGDSGTLTLKTRHSKNHVIVDITDTGPGISEALASQIFTPFFTTKPPGQGTGLGLDIVYNIVTTRHHGRIDLKSKPGKTTFTVSLPLKLTSSSGSSAS